MKKALLASLLAVLPLPGRAQDAPPPAPGAQSAVAPAAETPKPAPELQKLTFLVGDWVHSETYQASPFGPAGPGKGLSKNSWSLGDHHLYMVYKSNTPMGTLEGRGFLHWDADKKAYALDWFDNMGAAVRYNGDFGADGALALVGEYAFKGQKVKERLSIKKQEDGQLLFKNEVGVGDAPLQLVGESLAAPKK